MTNKEKSAIMRDMRALKVNESDCFTCSRSTARNYARAAGIKVRIEKIESDYFRVTRIK